MLVTMSTARKTIPAGQFKAKCLGVLDQVYKNKEVFVITKRGRPVAKVIPMEENEPAPLEGSVQYHEDIVAPTGEVWDADS